MEKFETLSSAKSKIKALHFVKRMNTQKQSQMLLFQVSEIYLILKYRKKKETRLLI